MFKKLLLKNTKQGGLLLVEIVLAVAIFSMLTFAVLSAFIYGRDSSVVSGDNNRATEVLNETIESVHNISQGSYANLSNYTNGVVYYPIVVNSTWSLTTTPQLINSLYTPAITFSAGPNSSRQVTISVSWKENSQRQGLVTSTTYYSNWQATTNYTPSKTGILVFANGGNTSDSVLYRQLQTDGTWTNAVAFPKVESGNPARVARSVKIYPATHSSAKTVLARYFDGTSQYLYAFVWNGNSWAAPQLLTQWNSTGYLDVGNFSGSYLANGTFLAVYSDGTSILKSRTYSSSVWSAQTSLPDLSKDQDGDDDTQNIVTSITLQARPGTNEAMAALLYNDTSTYAIFYGKNAWGVSSLLSSSGDGFDRKLVDFAWSPVNPLQGVVAYSDTLFETEINAEVFTADGQGSGSWGSPYESASQWMGAFMNSLQVSARPTGANDYAICDKDVLPDEDIWCYKFNPASGFSSPANQLLTNKSAYGPQKTYDLAYEAVNGNLGINVYSDNTAVTKLKRFDTTNNSWDGSPLSFSTANAIIQKTRVVPQPTSNDMLVLATDGQGNLYSAVYSGTNNSVYTTPSGYAWNIHNASGPSVNAQWFDFAWDN